MSSGVQTGLKRSADEASGEGDSHHKKGDFDSSPAYSTQCEEAFVRVAIEWLALEADRVQLLEAWVANEAELHRTYGWVRLNPSQQAKIPEGAILDQIDRELDLLGEQGDALLVTIAAGEFQGVEAAIAAIQVAEQLVQPEDSLEAHAIISRAAKALLKAQSDLQSGAPAADLLPPKLRTPTRQAP